MISSLEENPFQGAAIGHYCYKIRLAISSKRKGKSGGARIITHIHIKANSVFLLSVYDKSELGTIASVEVIKLLQEISS